MRWIRHGLLFLPPVFREFPPVISARIPACTVDRALRKKIAKFDERTIEREISRLQSMACETTAVFAANEGWLGVGAYD
jgi:hypothetical protein